jgi:hypothetical protein
MDGSMSKNVLVMDRILLDYVTAMQCQWKSDSIDISIKN